MTDWLTAWLIDLLTDEDTDWRRYWLTDMLTDWLTIRLIVNGKYPWHKPATIPEQFLKHFFPHVHFYNSYTTNNLAQQGDPLVTEKRSAEVHFFVHFPHPTA